jgi:hypothetical protein
MTSIPRAVRLSLSLLSFVVVGCSTPRPPTANEPRPMSPPTEPTTTGAQEKRTPATITLDSAEVAIRAKDYAKAAAKIEEARRLATAPGGELGRAVYLETSLHAYRGDYEAAARVLVEHLKVTDTQRDEPAAFHEHNWLSILRQAQGDLFGALMEADARTRFGDAGSWPSPPNAPRGSDRATQVKLKETWHRAYLLRMHAQQVSGSRKTAALAYAEGARQEYAALARPLGGYEDSIAVLEAFFAMHDGDMPRATAAAKRVDVAKNDDVEDLYLVYSALDAAGDREAAASAKKQIDAASHVAFVVPIIRTWIQHDGEPGPKRWSPRFPTGQP